jgi:hypothetical protein
MRRITDPRGFLWEIREAGELAPSGRVSAPSEAAPPALWLRISAAGERDRIVTAAARSLAELSDAELLGVVAKALATDGPAPGGR